VWCLLFRFFTIDGLVGTRSRRGWRFRGEKQPVVDYVGEANLFL
jgi:hypothetical protein